MRAMILSLSPLGMPWPTLDPFLFCVHHDDRYPRGNGRFGPDAALLAGRQLGSDFSRQHGWSMYHGQQVPGFPAHPHRGFETVTLVRRGRIDHSDSLGAAARFGDGDAQWLTAGRGIVHAEMFPLLDETGDNPLELFQIWLNLPARSKMCEPYFSMLWAEQMPRAMLTDAAGARTELVVVAGHLGPLHGLPARPSTPGALGASGTSDTFGISDTPGLPTPATLQPLPPPPDSWASVPGADLGIFTLALDAGARFALPAAAGRNTRRVLYYFVGAGLQLAGRGIEGHAAIEVDATRPLDIVNTGSGPCELLVLQGRPIGEPVAQYGPFVMNTEAEIRAAFADYQRTRFGGWPWPDEAPVHGADAKRFARGPGDVASSHPG
jgi:quercetin 2,3-dioxygenase